MAGVAQLVELWIVIPMPLSNISDLTPKTVRTSADGWFECRPNADQIQTNRKERMGLLHGGCLTCEESVGVTHRRFSKVK